MIPRTNAERAKDYPDAQGRTFTGNTFSVGGGGFITAHNIVMLNAFPSQWHPIYRRSLVRYAEPNPDHPVVIWMRARYAAWLRIHNDYAPEVRT